MREEILNKALELADIIEVTANGLMELSFGYEEVKGNIAFIEANIAQEIASETDDKGKPVFSNESARAAELLIRVRSHELHKEGTTLLRKSAENKTTFQNQLEKYRSQLSLYKAFLSGGNN